METQLQTCYFTKKGPSLVTLFGYASKSVPGLEINGLGKYGRAIKEKIVFVTRTRSLPIPLKRFVINAEIPDDLGELETASVKWLEYPLLLHYWYLAGLLPISKLDNCLAVGSLSPSGLVEEPVAQDLVDLCAKSDLRLITAAQIDNPYGMIDGRDLFGAVAELDFKWKQGLPFGA